MAMLNLLIRRGSQYDPIFSMIILFQLSCELYNWQKFLKLFFWYNLKLKFSSILISVSAMLCLIATLINDKKSAESNFSIEQQILDGKSNCSAASKRENFLYHFAECFSLVRNYRFIMSTQLGEKSIEVIHGLRTVAAFWIICGHIYFYAYGAWDNLQLAFVYSNSILLQPFFASPMGTDSFFAMRFDEIYGKFKDFGNYWNIKYRILVDFCYHIISTSGSKNVHLAI